jgi:NADH-quinone oxidoreductase subunit H
MSWELLVLLFSVLVFPGYIFLSFLALVTQWYERKLLARIQNRMGPTYVGPIGLAQPFADFLKLVTVKELVINKGILWTAGLFLIAVGMGALSSLVLFFPISPIHLVAPFDVFVFIYIFLYATIAFLAIGMLSSNPFAAVGSSRYATMIVMAEPALAIILVSASLGLSRAYPLSLSESLIGGVSNPLATVMLAVGLLSYIFVLIAKGMIKPYDIPEAETELAGGLFAELSGPILGMAMLLHDIELSFMILLGTFLFLRGPYPFTFTDPLGWLMIIIKYFILLTVVAVIAGSVGRVRIEQSLSTLTRWGLLLSIIAFAISVLLYVGMI